MDAMRGTAQPSKRIRSTDTPCIVTMQRMLKGKEGILSLAQGIVHWAPPAAVADALISAAREPDTNAYGPDDGLPALREALAEKLLAENGLDGVDVMVTAGANQAYSNIVLALLDAQESAVLFSPFYFNHMMAIQMTGGADTVLLGPVDTNFFPDVDWLEQQLSERSDIRMVTVVNPCNPTGVMLPAALLERLKKACGDRGVWLVVDNTYEHFSYEAEGHPEHRCVGGDHVINVFSFSKAYGMMGWRVGYLAHPPRMKDELMKAQDTIAICPTVVSQKAALAAHTGGGRAWVSEHVKALSANRAILVGAVSNALGEGHVSGGSGAIYLMVRLPPSCQDDIKVVEWLSNAHKVCAIPGSACGAPGMLRLCYANLPAEKLLEAAQRLEAGLRELADRGAAAME